MIEAWYAIKKKEESVNRYPFNFTFPRDILTYIENNNLILFYVFLK